MQILVLTLHRTNRAPGQRFRHEQYLKDLEKSGYSITYSNILESKDDTIFYGNGKIASKIGIGLKSLFKRVRDIVRSSQFDYIFIYRDAFFFGTFIERLLKLSGSKFIYDFDDSIWLADENPSKSIFQKLKNPLKTNSIIKLSDTVVVGNEYLASHARQFNQNVKIIPTTIDLKEYVPKKVEKAGTHICIGWSGSFSTVKHFETAIGALQRLKEKYGRKISFKLIGDANYRHDQLGITGQPWRMDSEIDDLCEIDIGIMPLPNDDWSKGKCGLKGLQYMALEIPTIMSPVGVNHRIIKHGVNGFLAETDDEWVECISMLIDNDALRKSIGAQGRKTVEREYSVEANKEKWLALFT